MPISQSVLSAVFSDETPMYRFPEEPNPGDTVTLRIRVARDSAKRVAIVFEPLTVGALMVRLRSDEYFDYYEGGIICNRKEILYRFLIECTDGGWIAYDRIGVIVNRVTNPELVGEFRTPGVDVLAYIPADSAFAANDIMGKSVMALPADSAMLKGAEEALRSIDIL